MFFRVVEQDMTKFDLLMLLYYMSMDNVNHIIKIDVIKERIDNAKKILDLFDKWLDNSYITYLKFGKIQYNFVCVIHIRFLAFSYMWWLYLF